MSTAVVLIQSPEFANHEIDVWRIFHARLLSGLPIFSCAPFLMFSYFTPCGSSTHQTESPGTSGPVSPDRDHEQQEAKGESPDGDGPGDSSDGSAAEPSSPARPQVEAEESRGSDAGSGPEWTLRSALEHLRGEKCSDDEVSVLSSV